MKLENQLIKIEDKLREAAESRNLTAPVRDSLRNAIDAVVQAQRELNDTHRRGVDLLANTTN